MLDGLLAQGLSIPHDSIGIVPIGASKDYDRLKAAHPVAFEQLQPMFVFRPTKSVHVAGKLPSSPGTERCRTNFDLPPVIPLLKQ